MTANARLATQPKVMHWIIPFLVIALVSIFIRLGFWQLDRLAQRRAHNAEVTSRLSMPVLNLNNATIPNDPTQLDYRTAQVSGQYDFSHQVVLGGQVFNGQVGGHLLTPLVFSTSGKVVLVDRGWIPENDLQRASWAKYDQPGNVTITGRLMVPVVTNWRLAKPTNSQTDFVPSVNLDFIGYQAGYPLLPVYLIATAQPEGSGPQASLPPLDLSEGPHLSYAIQWFTFAAGLGIGYPIYLILRKRKMQPQQ